MISLNQGKKYGPIISCIILVFAINVAAAALSDTYEMSDGDMAAMQLNLYGQSKWKSIIEQYDAPFLAYYNRTDDRIVVQIYGTKDKVQPARDMIDLLRKLLDKDFIPSLKNIQNIDLIPNDIKLIYRNRTEEGMREILYWENGKFIFPINE
ncbi:MAG: hypothetical protein WBB37_03210 [bacterium]